MELEDRLRASLDSPPEVLFYDTYIEIKNRLNGNIPALLPQVYLYYDPKLARDRIKRIFEHQIMYREMRDIMHLWINIRRW